jgi:hypothetical protein
MLFVSLPEKHADFKKFFTGTQRVFNGSAASFPQREEDDDEEGVKRVNARPSPRTSLRFVSTLSQRERGTAGLRCAQRISRDTFAG